MPLAGLLLKNKGTAGEGEQTAQLDLIISEKEREREGICAFAEADKNIRQMFLTKTTK